ncbi:hypothetical protein DFS33DRAFT_646460 [Desarmillaria ectypa]|nr:hypothetical protein DFS33DRAFT_646460 [Desarmillaria ectypa]
MWRRRIRFISYCIFPASRCVQSPINPKYNKMYYTRSKPNVLLSWSDSFEELPRSIPVVVQKLKFGSFWSCRLLVCVVVRRTNPPFPPSVPSRYRPSFREARLRILIHPRKIATSIDADPGSRDDPL